MKCCIHIHQTEASSIDALLTTKLSYFPEYSINVHLKINLNEELRRGEGEYKTFSSKLQVCTFKLMV